MPAEKKKNTPTFNYFFTMYNSSIARKKILITSSHLIWLLFIYLSVRSDI